MSGTLIETSNSGYVQLYKDVLQNDAGKSKCVITGVSYKTTNPTI